MKKLILLNLILFLTIVFPIYAQAHHGTENNYWHVHWNAVGGNLTYSFKVINANGGSYTDSYSVWDWNRSQTKLKLNKSTTSGATIDIQVDYLPTADWGWVTTYPGYSSTSDTHLSSVDAFINSNSIEYSIKNNGRPTDLRYKVITHEIGHSLGLAHPSSSLSTKAIMHQGWNGYDTVQSNDIYWINYRYNHSH